MKIHVFTLIIPVFLFASVCFADYGAMKKELKDYTPQDSFAIRQSPDIAVQKTPSHTAVPFPAGSQMPDRSQMHNLKQGYEKDMYGPDAHAAAMGVDEKTLAQVSQAGDDPKNLAALIAQKIDLEEITAIAVLQNPDIKAARKKVLAEIQSFDQVTHLDDSLQQYAAFTAALNNRVGPLKAKDSIKAGHPFPGLAALKGRIVQSQVNMLVEQMKIVSKQVRQDMENAYWELAYTTRSILIIHETMAAFDRLLDVAASLYKSGRTSYQDVIKVTIKIEDLNEERVSLENEADNIKTRLLELMNLPADTRMGPVKTAPLPEKIPPPEKLISLAREHRQELAAIRFQISKLQSMVELAESMKQAKFTLGFSYFEADHVNTAGSGAPQQAFAEKTMASMKNNQPVNPWYGVDSPWVQQTRQTLAGLEHTLTARENATDRMVHNAWFKTDKNLRELDLYKNRILPLTKSALDVSTREYETGSIAFSQAIGSYTDWLNVKLAIAQKTKDLGISFAVLETVVGTTL
ncbi:MAG: TolC family protein [Desulfotignum sp.]|jgi:outer membrane protein TolC|nr:TolC family protein [Desulfotignum sp.]